jgi:hypothetical protein
MQARLQSWHILTITVYTTVVAFAALLFSWPVVWSLFLMCGVPLLLLAWQTNLPLVRLFGVVVVLSVVIMVIDAVAHSTGSWYTITQSPWRLLGVSFESALFAFAHCLYFLVLYEFLCDDNRMVPHLERRFLGIVAVIISLLIASFYLFSVYVVSYAFAWIIGLLLAVLLLLMLLTKSGHPLVVLRKVALFGVLMWPLSLLFEVVALAAGVRVFAFSSEYIFTLQLLGAAIPLEELLLLFLWPTLLAFMYESFVDDYH